MVLNESSIKPMLDTTSPREEPYDDFVSREVTNIIMWVVVAVLCQIVSMFGIVTNIINIVCFLKQGVKDSVNINFIGLAVSDLCSLITLVFANIGSSPWFEDLDLPLEPIEVLYLSCGWPHVTFARMTSWITALITLERCLCITRPLKVKLIFTPKHVTAILSGLCFTLLLCSSPLYYAYSLGWKFSPQRNRTILGILFTADGELVNTISFSLNNIVLSFSSFTVVIICTVVLVISLRRKVSWRGQSTAATKEAQTSANRDHKVARMVIVISVVFIICYFPVCVAFIAMIFIPELTAGGKYVNLSLAFGGFGVLLESTNSAMNFIIYYNMSSNYRFRFCKMFGLVQRGFN